MQLIPRWVPRARSQAAQAARQNLQPGSAVPPPAPMLGDLLPGEYLLRRLITAVTQAPEGMPRYGALGYEVMLDHAYWVATALIDPQAYLAGRIDPFRVTAHPH